MISVRVIDKSSGRCKMIKTIGSSSDLREVERLTERGNEWIRKHTGVRELDFTDYRHHTHLVLQGLEEISVCGPELLLGKIFDEI
ncbi:MAG: hypothetical protein LC670_03950 [Flavobacteriales bacterium]|nr:hypothetical protein [Flavobacteriales bacterium]